MLSEITLSPIAGHLRVIGLPKQRSQKKILDIPVVTLKPEQALELFKLAPEKVDRVVFGHRMEKLKKNVFGQILKKVRTEFKKHFKFPRLKKSSRLREEATMHTGIFRLSPWPTRPWHTWKGTCHRSCCPSRLTKPSPISQCDPGCASSNQ